MKFETYYEEKGSGEPLILLHGNGEDHSYFVHQLEYFSRRYRVIAVDTRGHGQTPRGRAPFTIRQFADDLYVFMQNHKIDRAHILGFSDGGNIALIFAMKFPALVDKLIVNGANLSAKGVKPTVQLPIVLGYKLAGLCAKRSESARQKAELLGLMVNEPQIAAEDLQKISAKTLVIAGTKDMIKSSHTRFIAAHIPDAELVILPGDHFIANKQHHAFNSAVDEFLKP